MKEISKSIKELYKPYYDEFAAPAKKIIRVLLFVALFIFIGDYLATLLIQDWAGCQIEEIAVNSGWMFLKACLTGLTALFSYSMYLWIRNKKNPFSFPRKISWGGLFFGFFSFYLVGYIISTIVVEICSGIQIEDLPARGGWMMFRSCFIGLAALGARWVYFILKRNDEEF